MSETLNLNEHPRDSTPYAPPGQTKTLTDNPDENKIKQTGGGTSSGGSTVVFSTDSLIQSTAEGGIQGSSTSSTDTKSDATRYGTKAYVGSPMLEPPSVDVETPDFAALAGKFLDSLQSFYSNKSVLNTVSSSFDKFGKSSKSDDSYTKETDTGAPSLTKSDDTAAPTTAPATTASSSAAQVAAAASDPAATEVEAAVSATAAGATTSKAAVVALTDVQLQDISDMNSSDLQNLTAFLVAMGVPANEVDSLAAAMQAANKNGGTGLAGLDSDDPSLVLTAISNAVGLLNAPSLSAAATAIAALNAQLSSNLSSTDPTVVAKALTAQTPNNNLSPAESAQVQTYLSLLAQALAFMATIQATITQLEGSVLQQNMKAKTQQTDDVTANAVTLCQNQMQAIEDNVQAQIAQIAEAAKSKAWGIMGPIITAAMAIISVVMIVGTFGVASPAAVALLTLTVAMTTLTICEQTTNMNADMCKAMGINNPTAIEAFSAGFQMAVAIVMTAVTFGGASVMLGDAAAEVTAAQLASGTTKQMMTMGIVALVQPIFTSGLMTDALTQLASKCGANASDAAIIGVVLTIVVMLMMVLVAASAASKITGSMASSATAGAGNSAANASAGVTLTEVGDVDDAGGRAASNAVADETDNAGAAGRERGMAVDDGDPLGAASNAASANAAEDVTMQEVNNETRSMTQRMLDTLQKNTLVGMMQGLKNMELLLQLVQGCMQAASSYQNYQYNNKMSDLDNQQASLATETSQLQAVMTFLQSQLKGYDKANDTINKDIQQLTKFVSGLLDLIKSFAQTLSSASTQLVNTVG